MSIFRASPSKRKKRSLLPGLTIGLQVFWLIAFVIDLSLFKGGGQPIFVMPFTGAGFEQYVGVGYGFSRYAPLVSGMQVFPESDMHYAIFIGGQVILLAVNIVFSIIRKRFKEAAE